MDDMTRTPLDLAALALALALASGCNEAQSASATETAESAAETSLAGSTSSGSTSSSTSGSTSGSTSSESTSTGSATVPDEDYDAVADDFVCILDWTQVRNFRIHNFLGHLDDAIAVAESVDGGDYPVGTVIQLVPSEAMVKRGAGLSPESGDWEFFELKPTASGTEIGVRGFAEVVNQFGGNCLDCHAKAEPQWDFICEKGHGCDPLPFTDEQIAQIQMSDPRCD